MSGHERQRAAALLERDPPGSFTMWRYRKLLPVPDGPVRHPVPVGGTPLLSAPALRQTLGTPRRSPSSITSAVARSLLDAVGCRVSSLIHKRGVPTVCLSAGAGSNGVPPTGNGYCTGPSGTGSSPR